MLGELPFSLRVNDIDRAIRSDFRVALVIFSAIADPELSEYEKAEVLLESLYVEYESIPIDDIADALKQAATFLDCGADSEENAVSAAKVLDWEQDEQMIFSAVNKVAGQEIRVLPYLHWWSFMGYFNGIGEGLLSTVIAIRQKRAKGKKLEEHEREFYRRHKAMIDLKTRYTAEEQAELDYWNNLLG